MHYNAGEYGTRDWNGGVISISNIKKYISLLNFWFGIELCGEMLDKVAIGYLYSSLVRNYGSNFRQAKPSFNIVFTLNSNNMISRIKKIRHSKSKNLLYNRLFLLQVDSSVSVILLSLAHITRCFTELGILSTLLHSICYLLLSITINTIFYRTQPSKRQDTLAGWSLIHLFRWLDYLSVCFSKIRAACKHLLSLKVDLHYIVIFSTLAGSHFGKFYSSSRLVMKMELLIR